MQEKLIKIGLLLGVCVIFQLNTMQEHEKIDISVAFDKDSAAQLRVGSIPIDTTVRSGYSTARDIIQHIVEDVIIKIHNYPYHIHNPRLEWAYKNGFLFLWKDNKQLLPSDTIHASSGDTILIKYDGPELPRVQTKPKPSAPVGEYLKQYGTLKPVDISHQPPRHFGITPERKPDIESAGGLAGYFQQYRPYRQQTIQIEILPYTAQKLDIKEGTISINITPEYATAENILASIAKRNEKFKEAYDNNLLSLWRPWTPKSGSDARVLIQPKQIIDTTQYTTFYLDYAHDEPITKPTELGELEGKSKSESESFSD